MEIVIPSDVKQWVAGVFRACNERTSAKMSKMPTTHETSLDLTFVEHFSQFRAPIKFPSEWLVRIDTHYLGGMRHFMQWEIADIGLLVIFRRGTKVVKSKIALLQSKRLYPDGEDFDEDTRANYEIGFGRLFEADHVFAELTRPQTFTFSDSSQYKAISIGDNQYEVIKKYEDEFNIPVYYQLYNPWQIPSSREIPVTENSELTGTCDVGCRIIPARVLRQLLDHGRVGAAPTFANLKQMLPTPFTEAPHQAGWSLEHFVAELLITCQAGYITTERDDVGLARIFNRRTGPIAAAIAITFDIPTQ